MWLKIYYEVYGQEGYFKNAICLEIIDDLIKAVIGKII